MILLEVLKVILLEVLILLLASALSSGIGWHLEQNSDIDLALCWALRSAIHWVEHSEKEWLGPHWVKDSAHYWGSCWEIDSALNWDPDLALKSEMSLGLYWAKR